MNNLKVVKENFVEVFSNWKYLVFAVLIITIFGYLLYIFTDFEIVIGNYGLVFALSEMFMLALIVLLFGIFLPVSIYKYAKFSSFSMKENSSSIFGTFIGVLVTGCPSCSITLASYVGLGGFLSFLPWGGMSLKVISIPLLGYANYSILRDLNICKTKLKK